MAKKELCPIGQKINHALVDVNQTKKWLIEQVRKDTGKYFDGSYLYKIEVGELTTPTIIESICKILQISDRT